MNSLDVLKKKIELQVHEIEERYNQLSKYTKLHDAFLSIPSDLFYSMIGRSKPETIDTLRHANIVMKFVSDYVFGDMGLYVDFLSKETALLLPCQEVAMCEAEIVQFIDIMTKINNSRLDFYNDATSESLKVYASATKELEYFKNAR